MSCALFCCASIRKRPGHSRAALIIIWKQTIIRTPEHLLPPGVALLLSEKKHRKRQREDKRLTDIKRDRITSKLTTRRPNIIFTRLVRKKTSRDERLKKRAQ